MRRNLAVLILVLLTSGFAQPIRAAADEELFAVWTQANRLSADGAKAEELAEVLVEMGAICDRTLIGSEIRRLYAAECNRWIGEKWISIDRLDAAEDALRSAYTRYGAVLGSVNPLSGEVLHLLASLYLEQDAWPDAGLAMDRALTLLPPVDQADVMRCRAVYGSMKSVPAPRWCTAGLATHEMAAKVVESKMPASESRHLQYGEIKLSGNRLYRGFSRDGKRAGYGLEIGEGQKEFWRGSYREGSLNGRAVWFRLTNGRASAYYAGGWKGGWRSGYGTLVYENGNRYAGEFRDGFPNGSGELRWSATDSYYVGEVAESDLNGTGTLIVPGLLEYIGEWENGLRDGEGTERFLGGLLEYRGAYANGKPTGVGRLFVNQHEVFSGEFDPEMGPGFGLLGFGQGKTFIGQLMDGIPNGFGMQKVGIVITTGIWKDSQRVRGWNEKDFEDLEVRGDREP